MSTWVWTDGAVAPAADARIGATDRGVLLGDGVYETCKVVDGAPFALTRHLARLRRSAALIGIALPWGDSLIRSACAKAVGAALIDPLGDGAVGRLRITVTGGAGPLGPDRGGQEPTLIVAAGPSRTWEPTTDVITVGWAINERSPSVGAKTTSYLDSLLALAEAHRAGADEAVLANTAGILCEGTGSNVFLVVDGVLCTPSLASGCLPGVTRALVCEAVEVVERDDLTLDDLRAAPEAFLTSSTRDVHPVARVDGRVLHAVPGPRTTAAATAFAAIAARTIDP
ncbi:aminotransferase class IV [Aquihabitans sp. G128]|uniref:aminotransferase class IV n=1 Tax=Aquihabitans sp. G128 TaxID=2849779 RepID=UPI001C226DFC|nr:aminotransferase class IV [Aquihabitans sp. G128]QXC61425.1 aminotransferase class IV [Aquihabitans sp. G128]